ncbi:MAG TPA: SRPBCC family protein [Solirubrobacteraceae bacterium]|nr:SRPBCC family protein [Solirubrobacteraceae bacterium]
MSDNEKVAAVSGWGSTSGERAAAYPCDSVVPDAVKSVYRALDVNAPAAVVWRWLCQLRVAPYSYDILDNLGRRSPRTLTPGLDQLAPGQTFMMIYELVDFEPDQHITVATKRFPWMIGRQVITYQVTGRPGGGSRLVAKRRIRPPKGPFWPMVRFNLPVIDLIMTRKQLRTLKRLAERQAANG